MRFPRVLSFAGALRSDTPNQKLRFGTGQANWRQGYKAVAPWRTLAAGAYLPSHEVTAGQAARNSERSTCSELVELPIIHDLERRNIAGNLPNCGSK